MNINNFESFIDETILDRGFSYYVEGNVKEVYESGNNRFIFSIQGSDDYKVTVELGENGDILFSMCNCPYDFGPVCKHEVAAYFQLHKMLNQQNATDNFPGKVKKQLNLKELLSRLSKEELVNIIINMTENDDALEKSLIFKYSNGEYQLELEACQELIDSIVHKYTGRRGFIDYRGAGDFADELEIIVEKARDTENPLLALDIAFLLIEEGIDAFGYADDSSGSIGFLVEKTLDLVGEIAANHNEEEDPREELFDKLLAMADNPVFDGWSDYKINLLESCLEFADDEKLRERLRSKLQSLIVKKESDRSTNYENESLLHLIYVLIEQYGTEEEAEQFIHKHLEYPSFREKLLNQYLQEKNYQKIIKVTKEGEEQDRAYPGLISRWKKFRYQAYRSLSLKEEQQKLAKELLLDGDFEYYHDLKELSADHFSEFYKDLKRELKTTANGWRAVHIFKKVIEEENDLDEMLQSVRDNPRYVEEYAEKLVKEHKEEVIKLYIAYIDSEARRSSNRRGYQEVCNIIRRFKKIAGKQKQAVIINQLKDIYRRRPAFIDELGKIK